MHVALCVDPPVVDVWRFCSGEYMHDRVHGVGAYYFTNGQVYEGRWESGKKSGPLVYTVETGQCFAAEFADRDLLWYFETGFCVAWSSQDGLFLRRFPIISIAFLLARHDSWCVSQELIQIMNQIRATLVLLRVLVFY